MNLEKLERYSSLLSNIGVIAGIVFLVIEINQNNELLAAQDRYNRLQVATYGPNLFLEDADLPTIFYETDPSERTVAEKNVVGFYWENLMRGFEWTFRELPIDEIPAERWRRGVDCDFILDGWERRRSVYDPEFAEYFETNVLATCP